MAEGGATPGANAQAAIARHAGDGRNFVKKSVNWALRQIGKKNSSLRLQAIALAEEIARQGTSSARWIARDALRELQGRGPS